MMHHSSRHHHVFIIVIVIIMECTRTPFVFVNNLLVGQQVAQELLAALLHLQNDYALEDFVRIRQGAMVALTVTCPKEVCLPLRVIVATDKIHSCKAVLVSVFESYVPVCQFSQHCVSVSLIVCTLLDGAVLCGQLHASSSH